ncbi:MAG TPA: hypothetical protein VME63_02930 [Dyella sp.]|uniref:hypothetical protein n=1 Tax=Dyella sp. TaxID=1869338 RepID=UPI002C8209B2|nr:hypothetical protein [Dyella sp.]HTV84331.1 hypothetical protein [Dyella sp.]
MHIKIPALLFVLVIVSGCAHQISSNSVVLSRTQAEMLLHQCSRPTPDNVDGFWSVSDQVAQNVDRDIDKISTLQSTARIAISRPHEYFRQYGGIVISGRQFVYINAIRYTTLGQTELPWKTKAVRICDGGETSWGALYDPATNSFSQLEVNGSI